MAIELPELEKLIVALNQEVASLPFDNRPTFQIKIDDDPLPGMGISISIEAQQKGNLAEYLDIALALIQEHTKIQILNNGSIFYPTDPRPRASIHFSPVFGIEINKALEKLPSEAPNTICNHIATALTQEDERIDALQGTGQDHPLASDKPARTMEELEIYQRTHSHVENIPYALKDPGNIRVKEFDEERDILTVVHNGIGRTGVVDLLLKSDPPIMHFIVADGGAQAQYQLNREHPNYEANKQAVTEIANTPISVEDETRISVAVLKSAFEPNGPFKIKTFEKATSMLTFTSTEKDRSLLNEAMRKLTHIEPVILEHLQGPFYGINLDHPGLSALKETCLEIAESHGAHITDANTTETDALSTADLSNPTGNLHALHEDTEKQVETTRIDTSLDEWDR